MLRGANPPAPVRYGLFYLGTRAWPAALGMVFLLMTGGALGQAAPRPAPDHPSPQQSGATRGGPDTDRIDFGFRLRPVDRAVRWRVGPQGSTASGTQDRPTRRRVGGPHDAWRDPLTGLLHHQRRRFEQPGVRALVEQEQFVVPLDPEGRPIPGVLPIPVVGANTVFELTPRRNRGPLRPAGPPPASLLNTRLDLRVGESSGAGGAVVRALPQPRAWSQRRRVLNGPADGMSRGAMRLREDVAPSAIPAGPPGPPR